MPLFTELPRRRVFSEVSSMVHSQKVKYLSYPFSGSAVRGNTVKGNVHP
jgi:hypothetical protein